MDQDAEMRKMADQLQHFLGHEHPLLLNEHTTTTTQTDNECAGCGGEILLGPSFSCVDLECRFYLHKKCAEAPLEIIDNPFHPQHPLLLRKEDEAVRCVLCSKEGKGFLYHCSACEIYFDINCALLPRRDTAGNYIQIIHAAHQQHPLFLIGNDNNHFDWLHYSCCSRSTLDSASYACFECGILFHKTCLELPAQINHPFHRKHKLILDSEITWRDCNLCGEEHTGFFYCCSICKVEIHPQCASPPPVVEHKSHPHPFTLFLSPPDDSFNCDACGNKGNNVSYICSTCHIRVHKDCISRPLHIKLNLHPHPISRSFFLCVDDNDSRTWDCRICYKEVNIQHGSYSCSRPGCNFLIHVKCAADNEYLYDIVEVENPDEFEEPDWLTDKSFESIIRVIKEINVGEEVIAGEIVHFSHQEHNMIFSEETADDKRCNGCLLPVQSSYYYCSSQCKFILHKACAEFRRKARLWFDARPFVLLTDGIFSCGLCHSIYSGFSFRLVDDEEEEEDFLCLRCASLPHSFAYQANEPHYLFYDNKYKGKCNACAEDVELKDEAYRCKDCPFGLHMKCVTFPRIASHKCDEHSLTLAFQDKDDYSPRHYCDICEERRDTQKWFYQCETCDKAVHRRCVLEKYPFIKAGSNYTYEDHPHPLTFIKNIYYYPECIKCGEPGQDLALECLEDGCNYIVHWSCIAPSKYIYAGDDSSSESSDNE